MLGDEQGGRGGGTIVGCCHQSTCKLCRPHRNAAAQITGYPHHLTLVSVMGTCLSLPLYVEPYGPGESEYAACSNQLLQLNLAKRLTLDT